MSIILLIVIYVIFISLGLPDSLIGSSWPSISESLNINESLQGVLTITISFFTILSSFLTIKLIKRFKEAGVVAISIGLTVLGLLGLSFSNNFIFLCLSCIPLGLGAGAIDATLNNYVAINYKAIHLNFLHAFWGVGAAISPFLVSIFLTDLNGWRRGTVVLAIIQAVILIIVLSTLKVWKVVEIGNREKKDKENTNIENIDVTKLSFIDSFKIKGVIFALIAFFSYIAIEGLVGMWSSSLLVFNLNVDHDVAARFTSYFYLGLMIGRFISGFLSLKIKDKNMIRIGEGIVLLGLIGFLTFYIPIMPFVLFIIGLGCAPIFPSIVHATPNRFSKSLSQNVMSIQVGCAYLANLLVCPIFGVVGKYLSFKLLPISCLLFFILLVICNEITLIKTKNKELLLSDKLKKKLESNKTNI